MCVHESGERPCLPPPIYPKQGHGNRGRRHTGTRERERGRWGGNGPRPPKWGFGPLSSLGQNSWIIQEIRHPDALGAREDESNRSGEKRRERIRRA